MQRSARIRGALTKLTATRITKEAAHALHRHRGCGCKKFLRGALNNVVNHAFNDHSECLKYFECPVAREERQHSSYTKGKWLDELGGRLEAETFRASPLVPTDPRSLGLCLFPQGGAPKQSVALTRGIRVTASAVYLPEKGAFAYSIRIALLPPSHEGHVSAAARGFRTAQLHRRHWTLSASDGTAEHVHGDGVVGRYPLLREGGFRDDAQTGHGIDSVEAGAEVQGVFVYQSMSRAGQAVAFEGQLDFVPGSLDTPEGEPFQVRVERFPLTVEADEFLF